MKAREQNPGATWAKRFQQTLTGQGFDDVRTDASGGPDLTAVWEGRRLAFELKVSRGRTKELSRALAAAVLEAQYHADAGETSVGIVAVESISRPMRDELKAYAAKMLNDAPWGLIDGAGGIHLDLPTSCSRFLFG